MGINESKEILLNTYMHKLPVRKRITNRFDPNRALTLREFIELNPFLQYETDGFIGYGGEEDIFFCKKTLLWKELKEFLLSSGFTPQDWAMLIPDEKINNRKDFSFLNKGQILSLTINIISPGSSTSNKMFNVTVADLLKEESAPYNKQTIAIQNKLRSLGFSNDDGPFMKISKRDPESTRILRRRRTTASHLSLFNLTTCY